MVFSSLWVKHTSSLHWLFLSVKRFSMWGSKLTRPVHGLELYTPARPASLTLDRLDFQCQFSKSRIQQLTVGLWNKLCHIKTIEQPSVLWEIDNLKIFDLWVFYQFGPARPVDIWAWPVVTTARPMQSLHVHVRLWLKLHYLRFVVDLLENKSTTILFRRVKYFLQMLWDCFRPSTNLWFLVDLLNVYSSLLICCTACCTPTPQQIEASGVWV